MTRFAPHGKGACGDNGERRVERRNRWTFPKPRTEAEAEAKMRMESNPKYRRGKVYEVMRGGVGFQSSQ